MRCPAAEVCIGLALLAAWVGSAAAAGQPRWGGEVAAGAWSGSRDLDDRSGSAVTRATLTLDWAPQPLLRVRADLWADATSWRAGDGQRAQAGVREALLAWRGPCEPAVGKRVVAWGRTDVISPTDQLTPTDYRRLTPKDPERRLGVWGLHLNCSIGSGQLQAHVIDPRSFHRLPYAAQAGVAVLDERPRARAATAVKYEVMGSGLDGSISAIEGIDPHPTLALRGADAAGLRLGQTATRMRLLGADVAVSEGSRIWRAEAAWVDYENVPSSPQAQRRPWASAVLQVEWAASATDTLSLQGFVKRLRGEAPRTSNPTLAALQQAQGLLANELDRHQRGWTLRWARRFAGERMELEVLLVHALPRDDGLLRMRWSHTLSDSLRLSLGAEHYFGPTDSYLGNLRRNSLAFLEVGHVW